MHHLLFYTVVPDYATKREPYRAAHLDHAWRAVRRGELLLAGALANPVDGAVFHFSSASASVPEDFARADPYVLNGLVTDWRVRIWTTVVGEAATQPVYPEQHAEFGDAPSTCGEGLAANAIIPAKLGELLAATADVLERHIKALDPQDAHSKVEADAYHKLVQSHRGIADRLEKLAAEMTQYRDLPMGQHDEKVMTDPGGQIEAFQRLQTVERDLAALLRGRL
jgi:uncharacterized protein